MYEPLVAGQQAVLIRRLQTEVGQKVSMDKNIQEDNPCPLSGIPRGTRARYELISRKRVHSRWFPNQGTKLPGNREHLDYKFGNTADLWKKLNLRPEEWSHNGKFRGHTTTPSIPRS